jgi:hypothetical protein
VNGVWHGHSGIVLFGEAGAVPRSGVLDASATRGLGFLRRCGGVFGRAVVGNAPDCAPVSSATSNEPSLATARAAAAPDLGALFAGRPKAGREILVSAFGAAVFERHPHDLVAGRHGAVPRALQRHKQAALYSAGHWSPS